MEDSMLYGISCMVIGIVAVISSPFFIQEKIRKSSRYKSGKDNVSSNGCIWFYLWSIYGYLCVPL